MGKAFLILADGTVFEGKSIGAKGNIPPLRNCRPCHKFCVNGRG